MTTLISHFYNEQYLLPFWIEHHKKIFSKAILIDYHSNDNSINIIKEMAPEWKIISSRNKMFDAHEVDVEVMEIETLISGYKICLNTTEFLFVNGSLDSILNEKIYAIQKYVICDNGENSNPTNLNEFYRGCKFGYKSENDYRFMHDVVNYKYTTGRHNFITNDKISIDDRLAIAHCKYYPLNDQGMSRKLQISSQIPEFDKLRGLGIDHLMSADQIKNKNDELVKQSNRIFDNFLKEV